MAIKLKQIAGGAQLQTDVTNLKSQMEGLNGIPAKVTTLEQKVQTLETSMPQKIAEAKQQAIDAAAQDATQKANTAKSEAITAAEQTATQKANTAKTEAIAAAEEKVNAAKGELNTKVDGVKTELTQKINEVDGKFAGKQDTITNQTDLNARNLTLTGDLTVNGVTTIIESENVSIKDRLVELNGGKEEVEEVGIKAYVGPDAPAEGLIFKDGKWGVAKITDAQVPSFLDDSEDPDAVSETVSEYKALATEEHVASAIGTANQKVTEIENSLNQHKGNNEVHVDSAFKEKVNTTASGLEDLKGQVTEIKNTTIPAVEGKIEEVKQSVTTVQGRVEEVNGAVESVKEEVAGVKEQVATIEANKEFEEEIEEPTNSITLTSKAIEGSVKVFVNGVRYRKGFSVEGRALTWDHETAGFNLETSDAVEVVYVVDTTPDEEPEGEQPA